MNVQERLQKHLRTLSKAFSLSNMCLKMKNTLMTQLGHLFKPPLKKTAKNAFSIGAGAPVLGAGALESSASMCEKSSVEEVRAHHCLVRAHNCLVRAHYCLVRAHLTGRDENSFVSSS